MRALYGTGPERSRLWTRAGDLMQDLKTGALLKASPRSQFYGQMIGSLASVFVSAGAYKLYTRIYEVGPRLSTASGRGS